MNEVRIQIDNTVFSKSTAQEMFLPGLGLYFYGWADKHNPRPPVTIHGQSYNSAPPINPNDRFSPHDAIPDSLRYINTTANYEAGTDCIGFAQRCASYTGNSYSWRNLHASWAETGGSYADYLDGYVPSTNGRQYPLTSRELSDVILEKTIDHDFLYLVDNHMSELKKIIPGDIFYYVQLDESNNDVLRNGEQQGAHIAIVNRIEYNASGDVQDVYLIESTFDGIRYQNVLKTNTVAEYNAKHFYIVRLRVN